jgi:hypothetical protein
MMDETPDESTPGADEDVAWDGEESPAYGGSDAGPPPAPPPPAVEALEYEAADAAPEEHRYPTLPGRSLDERSPPPAPAKPTGTALPRLASCCAGLEAWRCEGECELL